MHTEISHLFVIYTAIKIYVCKYPGNFILIKIHVVKKLTITKMNPTDVRRSLFSFVLPSPAAAADLSRMMNPKPPMVNRNDEASPSIMYWPFTR